MSKQDFIDILAYGACEGSVQAVAPKCVDGSPGKEPQPCPVDVIDMKNPERLCNCCNQCRGNCAWMAQAREAGQHERMMQMQEITDYLDNE